MQFGMEHDRRIFFVGATGRTPLRSLLAGLVFEDEGGVGFGAGAALHVPPFLPNDCFRLFGAVLVAAGPAAAPRADGGAAAPTAEPAP